MVLLPKKAKEFTMGELGSAKMRRTLISILTALMLTEMIIAISLVSVGAPPDIWVQTDWSGGPTNAHGGGRQMGRRLQ